MLCRGGADFLCPPKTTWKLVPPKPKPLTPAKRSSNGAVHGVASLLKTNGLLSRSQAALGVVTCKVGGLTPL